MKNYLLPAILLVLTPFAASGQNDQPPLEVADIKTGENYIDVFVKSLVNGRPGKNFKNANDFILEERINNLPGVEVPKSRIIKVELDTLSREKSAQLDTFTILFLLEKSENLGVVDRINTATLIMDVLSTYRLAEDSRYYLGFLNEPENWKELDKNIDRGNLKKFIDAASSSDPCHLYHHGVEHFRNLRERKYPGKHVVFLFASGKNEEPANTGSRIPYNKDDLFVQLDSSRNLCLFTIGLGAPTNHAALKELSDRTATGADAFANAVIPEELGTLLSSTREFVYTHLIRLKPPKELFLGEAVAYKIRYPDKNAQVNPAEYVENLGSPGAPLILKSTSNELWVVYLLVGLSLLAISLGIFSLLLPTLRRQGFLRKYVRPYAPNPERGGMAIDIFTNKPLKIGEPAVYKCRQVTSLKTWQAVGWQCPHISYCMDNQFLNCNGEGRAEGDDNFFAMQGVYRSLNWLWFGAAGGLLGWMLFAALKIFFPGAYLSWLGLIVKSYQGLSNSADISPGLEGAIGNAILGTVFGAGLLCLLSWVEERGQSRRKSWVRILMRTVLGGLVTALIFLLGFVLQFSGVLSNPYLNGFFTWLLFGLAVGGALSVKSSISLKRGLFGGALASLAAFVVFAAVVFLIDQDVISPALAPLAQLLQLMIMGAILGFVVVTVVKASEDFELEYLSPAEYQRTVPISKWLKAGQKVSIGTAAGSYVYVKWEDPDAQPLHAELEQENGEVFILPFAETLVFGKMIPQGRKTKLHSGDVIQLGRHSRTNFKFLAKTGTNNHAPNATAPKLTSLN